MRPADDDTMNERLSHYELIRPLGEGGMGVVYLARDTILGRRVVVKVLRPDALGNLERRERLLREARAASALNHPHIVTVHDVGRGPGGRPGLHRDGARGRGIARRPAPRPAAVRSRGAHDRDPDRRRAGRRPRGRHRASRPQARQHPAHEEGGRQARGLRPRQARLDRHRIHGGYMAAFRLARQARQITPGDEELERLWTATTWTSPIRTEPAGAEVLWKDYADPEGPWERAGRTPIEGLRSPAYTFLRWRLEKPGFEPLEHAGFPPIEWSFRPTASSPVGARPVDDRAFEMIRSIYAYDRTDLEAETHAVATGSPHWSVERAGFAAAYGKERVVAHFYKPARVALPYQTVVFFPGAQANVLPSHDAELLYMEFVIRSGRALLFPIYQGTYERRPETPPARGSRTWRDRVIQRYKDLGRSLDYLESRGDVDTRRIAFLGQSMGAAYGVLFTALETRFATSILLAGGFDDVTDAPEVDLANFAPRVRLPTLMLNGRDDFRFPLEASQKPMFHALGTPEGKKRHALVGGGHAPERIELIREVLAWLDRWLGPVETRG